jgi:tetratricopeptide (TPR) repeat protein
MSDEQLIDLATEAYELGKSSYHPGDAETTNIVMAKAAFKDCFSYLENVSEQAKTQELLRKQAESYCNFADLSIEEGSETNSVLQYFEKAVAIYRQIGDITALVKVNEKLGSAYERGKDFQQALRCWQESRELYTDSASEVYSKYYAANACNHLGFVYGSIGRHEDAVRALTIVPSLIRSDTTSITEMQELETSFEGLARIWNDSLSFIYNPAKAIENYRNAIAIYEKLIGMPDSNKVKDGFRRSLANLAIRLRKLYGEPQSIELCNRQVITYLVQLDEQSFVDKSKLIDTYTNAIENLERIYVENPTADICRKVVLDCMKLGELFLGFSRMDSLAAIVSADPAMLVKSKKGARGCYVKAIEYCDKLATAKDDNDHKRMALCIFNLGALFKDEKKGELAKQQFLRASQIYKELVPVLSDVEFEIYASAQCALGNLANDYNTTIRFYKEAIRILNLAKVPNHELLAQYYDGLSKLFLHAEDFREAARCFTAIENELIRVPLKLPIDQLILNSSKLIGALLSANNLSDAKRQFDKAIAWCNFPESDYTTASIRDFYMCGMRLAKVYFEKKDYNGALPILLQIRELYNKFADYDDDTRQESSCAWMIGACYYHRPKTNIDGLPFDIGMAKQHLLESISSLESITVENRTDNDSQELLRDAGMLMKIYIDQQEIVPAMEFFDRAIMHFSRIKDRNNNILALERQQQCIKQFAGLLKKTPGFETDLALLNSISRLEAFVSNPIAVAEYNTIVRLNHRRSGVLLDPDVLTPNPDWRALAYWHEKWAEICCNRGNFKAAMYRYTRALEFLSYITSFKKEDMDQAARCDESLTCIQRRMNPSQSDTDPSPAFRVKLVGSAIMFRPFVDANTAGSDAATDPCDDPPILTS